MTTERSFTPAAESPEAAALGRAFRQARERAKLSMRDAARVIGISINTLRWHETGARMMRLNDLYQAARAIGCHPSDVLLPAPEPGKRKDPKP